MPPKKSRFSVQNVPKTPNGSTQMGRFRVRNVPKTPNGSTQMGPTPSGSTKMGRFRVRNISPIPTVSPQKYNSPHFSESNNNKPSNSVKMTTKPKTNTNPNIKNFSVSELKKISPKVITYHIQNLIDEGKPVPEKLLKVKLPEKYLNVLLDIALENDHKVFRKIYHKKYVPSVETFEYIYKEGKLVAYPKLRLRYNRKH